MAEILLTFGESITVGFTGHPGKHPDQVMLTARCYDPPSVTSVQIAAAYDGNRHDHIPALIQALQHLEAQSPSTTYEEDQVHDRS